MTALHDIPDPENYSTYFMKIDGVKFRGKVVPGDTLLVQIIGYHENGFAFALCKGLM